MDHSPQEDAGHLPDDFSGTVRLFPLPNIVMFPHVIQPLHIFEPRYRELLEDSLADDQLIAMALLKPGWEKSYDERPDIFPSVCIGRVVSHSQLADGRYNLLLLGVRRASLIRELPSTQPYRTAEVAIQDDLYPSDGSSRRAKLHRDLKRTFQKIVSRFPAMYEQFEQVLHGQRPLGELTDIIAFSLEFELPFKQKLLAGWNVDERAEMLLDELRALADGRPSPESVDRPFPPPFSVN